MFKILELKNTESALPAEVGYGYNTREQALAAVKKHLTTFKISGEIQKETAGGCGILRACESAGFPAPTEEDAAANAQFPEPKPSL